MTYQLRPRFGFCACGHTADSHGRKDFVIIYSYDTSKPCIICTCQKFQQETEDDINKSHSAVDGSKK